MKTLQSTAWRLAALGLSLGMAGMAHAQLGSHAGMTGQTTVATPTPSPQTPQTTLPPIDPSVGSGDATDAAGIRKEEQMEKMRNSDRQKKLIADTERLVALANQLKVDVDKSTKDTLSLDVVRKADEIEKLAHSVKDRMKGT